MSAKGAPEALRLFDLARKTVAPDLIQTALLPAARVGRDVARSHVRLGHGRKPSGEQRVHLRDAIFATKGKRGVLSVIFGVSARRAPHAHLVEFGTEPHRITPRPPRQLLWVRSLRRFLPFVEHPGSRKKPFLRPATKGGSKRAILRSIERELRRLLDRAARGTI